jgi:hypothetical protein
MAKIVKMAKQKAHDMFQFIANNEGNSVEGKYSQKIADAVLNNNDDFIKAFTTKVGDRGGKADPDMHKESKS